MYLFCGQLHYSQLFSGAFAGLLVCCAVLPVFGCAERASRIIVQITCLPGYLFFLFYRNSAGFL
ncbi:UNVERIFIED_ORG: hypothetical protein B5F06_03950 [Lacrimispora saccharolytica]|nr:hypothetical protein DW757_12870 [Clostridium sp. AM29-11AC]